MEARCLCGDIAWEASAPLQFMHDCHCSRCRKIHGTGYVTMAATPIADFRFLRGEAGIQRYAASSEGHRSFCGRCGSAVPGDEWNGVIFVPLGPLEGDYEAKSDGHIFAASKAPWYEISDGLPAFDTMPPGIDSTVLPDLGRGSGKDAAAGGTVHGSCLCGTVRFEVDGAPEHMRYCHCLRCRRGRSASHAANAFVRAEKFRWSAGEEQVRLFKLPEAERFSQAFCSACGSKLPWLVEAFQLWNVPIGSFDDDPGARPSAHIFAGSKAHWDRITDGLPEFEAYPDA